MLAVTACGGGDKTSSDSAATAVEVAGNGVGLLADTTAESLWAHMETQNYKGWQLWPEKGQLYKGQEPHGMLLTTYVNSIAHGAITSKAGTMPAGAIIVKENYMPDSTLAATTVMHKVTGYDSSNGDWYWMKKNADGTVEVAGRATMCVQCHGAQRSNDFVYTGSLSQ